MFVGIYLRYDTGKEFMPQFQKNVKETMESLQQGGQNAVYNPKQIHACPCSRAL